MDYFFLSKTPLFRGIKEDEIKKVLSCIGARERTYNKNEIIYRAGETVKEVGLVKSGSINIVVNFYWGGSRIFGHVEQGKIFAESYAAVTGKELICDVVAAQDSKILFLDITKLMTVCNQGCNFHQRLIYNLMRISAQKNLNLSSRMMHTAPKGIKDRLLSYLSEQAAINESAHFTIPFDRQQLADYLGVDRSAMSATLSKMQKEGLITFTKNEFRLNYKG
jgi:CRP-like cAMP-binding protein